MLGNLAEADRRAGGLRLAQHLSIDDLERIRPRLHQCGGSVDRFRTQLDRAVVSSGGRHHGRARRVRSDAVGNTIGLAVGHAHAPVVGAQNLRANLGHHRLEALAERSAAGNQLDHTGSVDLDPHAVGRT